MGLKVQKRLEESTRKADTLLHTEEKIKRKNEELSAAEEKIFNGYNYKDFVKAEQIKAKRKDIVETSETGKVTLENALLNRFIINRAGKKFLVTVAEKLTNKKLKKELGEILNDKDTNQKKKHALPFSSYFMLGWVSP